MSIAFAVVMRFLSFAVVPSVGVHAGVGQEDVFEVGGHCVYVDEPVAPAGEVHPVGPCRDFAAPCLLVLFFNCNLWLCVFLHPISVQ